MQITCQLAGGKFRPAEAQSATMEVEPGTPLTLEREPSNAYDTNAIKVFLEDLHIGYVPAKHAVAIAPLMDYGHEVLCTANGHATPLMPILSIEVDE